MPDTENRRPLASRNTRWADACVRALARTPVTPNQISFLSVVMAAVAGLCLALSAELDGRLRIVALVGAALFCQLRLICNLLDGMLAVEAGRGGPDGPFWNEVPDRVADPLILVGAGYGAGLPELGWAAAALAIFTAYLRAFGQSLGQPADYRGPMAQTAADGRCDSCRTGVGYRSMAVGFRQRSPPRSALDRRSADGCDLPAPGMAYAGLVAREGVGRRFSGSCVRGYRYFPPFGFLFLIYHWNSVENLKRLHNGAVVCDRACLRGQTFGG